MGDKPITNKDMRIEYLTDAERELLRPWAARTSGSGTLFEAVESILDAHMAAPDELTALRLERDREQKLRIRLTTLVGETQAERDALRERIRALADEWEELTDEWFRDERRSYGRATQLHVWMEKKLRAALGDA